LKKLRGQFHAEMNEEIVVENSSFSWLPLDPEGTMRN
jgi:hypothetical protein